MTNRKSDHNHVGGICLINDHLKVEIWRHACMNVLAGAGNLSCGAAATISIDFMKTICLKVYVHVLNKKVVHFTP
jgi:hypothetical protein